MLSAKPLSIYKCILNVYIVAASKLKMKPIMFCLTPCCLKMNDVKILNK